MKISHEAVLRSKILHDEFNGSKFVHIAGRVYDIDTQRYGPIYGPSDSAVETTSNQPVPLPPNAGVRTWYRTEYFFSRMVNAEIEAGMSMAPAIANGTV